MRNSVASVVLQSSLKKLRPVIEHVLRKHMGVYGFESADIREDVDHDGDDIIWIEAKYKLSKTPVDARAVLNTMAELRDVLIAKGEMRFPHLRNRFDKHQKIKGAEEWLR